ncbi:hypothetical protein BGW36DRAFT_427991 [Talaromyces proteolyticus]|uniref:Zn(2)-C6 fungal-type domain-containing protein n=1 Tax=Talaromyces proteolyticus TaxID=1131652 RepID=A0AAD4PV07_9EURO|nr:uncharacterized protein BGW36DRAFT_427991 [Talaromyces proteolyticus]KAH8695960.1 hypothetical protein BGW36DRAFT_427991 [Talaromyces proteolyticus]
MEASVAIDNKSKTLPPYGAAHPPPHHHHHPPPPSHPLHHPPPPPGPQRMLPPSEGPHHGLPVPHGLYDQQWRQPYPPPHFDNAEQRRHSTTGQPHNPLPHQSYPLAQPSRELPQLPPGDPYPRPNSLPAPPTTHSPSDALQSHPFRPMNGTPPEPAPPHSAPSDYRQRMQYPPPPPHDTPAPNNVEPQGPPSGQYIPPMPPPQVPATPGASYDSNYPPFSRQRKTARATQACEQCRQRKAKCDEGRPACGHCTENSIPCVYKDIPPHKQDKATQQVLDRFGDFEKKMESQLQVLGRFEDLERKMDTQFRKVFSILEKVEKALPIIARAPSPTKDILEPTKTTPITQELDPVAPSDNAPGQNDEDSFRHKEPKETKVDDDTNDVQMSGLSADIVSTSSESTTNSTTNSLPLNNIALNGLPTGSMAKANIPLGGLPAKSLPHSNLPPSNPPPGNLPRNNFPKSNHLMNSIARNSYILSEKFDQIVNPIIDEPLVKEERDGELSIPLEHTTAAHKLLSWPSIKRLLDDNIDPDYVMKGEENRGLIRLYGCGEGRDDYAEYYDLDQRKQTSIGSPSTTSSSPSFSEDVCQPPFPSWGVGLPAPPARIPERSMENIGGLDASGYLNTQSETVKNLHHSFIHNIHLLHPFLDEEALRSKIDQFIQRYGNPKRSFVGQSSTNSIEARGAKRKRSLEGVHVRSMDMSRSPSSSSSVDRWQPQRIERSVENAIILLVLALGAICNWREKLPPLATDPNQKPNENGSLVSSPAFRSSLSHVISPNSEPGSNSVSFQSPKLSFEDGPNWRNAAGRQSSIVGQDSFELWTQKNIDVVPGLAYYAYATDILGNLQGGSGLLHVQAALLAGLYAGQLAHPFQSHGWIYQASRACLVLIRTKKYLAMQEGRMKDLHDFAYWTCLQLESDILAELDLPASGISRSENRIDLPKGFFTLQLNINPRNATVMFFYSAQIHLRKVLNRVHTDLYEAKGTDKVNPNQSKEDKALGFSSSVLAVLGMNLDFWRKSLPEHMKWDDEDDPSPDINIARLRAKYYGARYIIYRPLLHYALHQSGETEDISAQTNHQSPDQPEAKIESQSSFTSHTPQSSSMTRWHSDVGASGPHDDSIHRTVEWDELPQPIQQACIICVNAAMKSTTAFDGVKGRPIVTNIFGTAHAQFGNMLVLSATYMSNLRHLVDRDMLGRLLQRTIKFLLQSENISPTLRKDASILEGIYRKIFPTPNTSFTE